MWVGEAVSFSLRYFLKLSQFVKYKTQSFFHCFEILFKMSYVFIVFI